MPGDQADGGILRLRLETHCLDALRDFYADKLALPVKSDVSNEITVAAGRTELKFVATPASKPIYHVAFNIPENKLSGGKAWLRQRTSLVIQPDGRDEYHFRSWNAHATYFLDPAGNILEFIARHNLKNAVGGDFSERDILHASEIGIVVDDVPAAAAAARDCLGLGVFANSSSPAFAAVGDDHCLLIIVKRGRPWFGVPNNPAAVFPTRAVISGSHPGRLALAPLPHEVEQVQS